MQTPVGGDQALPVKKFQAALKCELLARPIQSGNIFRIIHPTMLCEPQQPGKYLALNIVLCYQCDNLNMFPNIDSINSILFGEQLSEKITGT